MAVADKQRDYDCFAKAKSRGQFTFTVVAQDLTTPATICEWIKQNIETAPKEKLEHALAVAIECREYPNRKHAD
jgi:hypothetical protein